MTTCFVWVLLIAGPVMIIASLLRWFEQTADAVDRGDWHRLTILIVFPFSVWFYPSRIAAGRPTAVPRHEPVRGFGKVPAMPKESAPPATEAPPGTPPEFLGMPKIPPKKPKAAIDPEKLAKLKQKMKDQGMIE